MLTPRDHARWMMALTLALLVCRATSLHAQHTVAPESRALAYLAVEVPKWHGENKCFSCHNNGDAAVALIEAVRLGQLKDRRPLADTLDFLSRPNDWDTNGPDGPFKDKNLARVQFAQALAAAHHAGLLKDSQALAKAATLVAELQTPDGGWRTEGLANVGTPATYGHHLTTAIACRVLNSADPARFKSALLKARKWLIAHPGKSVLDAAASLWALSDAASSEAAAERARCLQLIRQAQSPDGGWGPFVTAPPEVFDTAIVLLALRAQGNQPELARLISRGRDYLVASQQGDGSWPATTRPSGLESYAQQLSTTGWAAQALLATRGVAAGGQ